MKLIAWLAWDSVWIELGDGMERAEDGRFVAEVPLGKTIGLRLPEDVDGPFRERAKAEGMTATELARKVICEWMASEGSER